MRHPKIRRLLNDLNVAKHMLVIRRSRFDASFDAYMCGVYINLLTNTLPCTETVANARKALRNARQALAHA